MNLYRLIYSSQASSELSPEDLKDISSVSEKNNLADGITGLLCYSNLMFLQILGLICLTRQKLLQFCFALKISRLEIYYFYLSLLF